MKRVSLTGLCLIAVLVITAVATAAANAADTVIKTGPGEAKIPGPFGTTITEKWTSDEVILHKSIAAPGQLEGGGNTFQGVEVSGIKCHSAGAKEGEVVTEALTEELGIIHKGAGAESTVVGLEQRPTTGEVVSRYTCGETKAVVKGGVIGVLTPLGKKVKPTEHFTVEDAIEGSSQAVTHFEGGATTGLTTEVNGESFGVEAFKDPGMLIPSGTLEVSIASGSPQFVESAAANPAHYFLNGTGNANRIAEAEKTPVIAWGNLSLTNVAGGSGGKVSCHNVIGGYVVNPGEGAAGAAGLGDTQSFNPYECESPQCTAAATGGGPATYISVLAEPNVAGGGNLTDLKWTSELIEEGTTIRGLTSGVHVNVICHVQTGPTEFLNVEEKSEGSNKPEAGPIRNKAVAPPETIFDAGSGRLQGPGAEKTREGKTEGELKSIGYSEQGIVNAKIG